MTVFNHAPVCQPEAVMFIALRDLRFMCLKIWIYKVTCNSMTVFNHAPVHQPEAVMFISWLSISGSKIRAGSGGEIII